MSQKLLGIRLITELHVKQRVGSIIDNQGVVEAPSKTALRSLGTAGSVDRYGLLDRVAVKPVAEPLEWLEKLHPNVSFWRAVDEAIGFYIPLNRLFLEYQSSVVSLPNVLPG